MSQEQYIPYTYLIGWSKADKWYYGSSYAKKSHIANPSELWVTYFTSSRHVKRMREHHGEPDVVEIRKTFNNGIDARIWEHRVLKRLNVVSNPKWINRSFGDGKFHNANGYTLSEEGLRRKVEHGRKRMVTNSPSRGKPAHNRGVPRTAEQKAYQSSVMKGRYAGQNNPFYGKKHTADAKEKNRLAHLKAVSA